MTATERLLGGPPRLQEAREVGALAQLRDRQLDPAGAGLPAPLAIAVAVVVAQRRCARPSPRRCSSSTSASIMPLGGEGQHLADQVRVGALLDQLEQRHSLVGHRRLRSGSRSRNPNLHRRPTMTTQRHHRPRAALRRRLRARPPTPPPGTRPYSTPIHTQLWQSTQRASSATREQRRIVVFLPRRDWWSEDLDIANYGRRSRSPVAAKEPLLPRSAEVASGRSPPRHRTLGTLPLQSSSAS